MKPARRPSRQRQLPVRFFHFSFFIFHLNRWPSARTAPRARSVWACANPRALWPERTKAIQPPVTGRPADLSYAFSILPPIIPQGSKTRMFLRNHFALFLKIFFPANRIADRKMNPLDFIEQKRCPLTGNRRQPGNQGVRFHEKSISK